MPVKTSVPSHWQMVKHANQNFLACAPHCSRSAHPLLYLCCAFLRNDKFVICAWAMCCPRDSRAKTKSPRLCDSTISNSKGRAKNRSMSPGSFRILSGGQHLLHFACLSRGPFDMQAQLGNSHSSSHAWHRPFQWGFFAFFVWGMDITKGAGLLQWLPFWSQCDHLCTLSL